MVPKGFKCVRCGACCEWEGPVRIDSAEIERIAAFLGMDVEKFIANHTVLAEDRRSLSLMESPDGSCAFYERESKSCRINAVKPRQCSSFPAFWSFPGWERLCEAAKRFESRQESINSNDAPPPFSRD